MSDLGIPGVLHSELTGHPDSRGRFTEMFRNSAYPCTFVQANHSQSEAGVLRGLHYHVRQSDLWYVVSGVIRVALADLRQTTTSPRTATLELSESHPASLFIPPGVAHGFVSLTKTDLVYWVSQEYDASDEHGVAWDDPALGLAWGVEQPILSPRDLDNRPLDWEEIPSFS